MKDTQRKYWEAQEKISAWIAFYNDYITFEMGGDVLKKKTVVFQRKKLYEEIWKDSLSTVAKKYGVPNLKLKEACQQANIPVPTLSYWGNLHSGKSVSKVPLPDSQIEQVALTFNVREGSEKMASAELSPNESSVQNEAVIQTVTEIIADIPQSYNGGNLYERETLYTEVWSEPVTKVAEKYGVSDVMIHKICKALDVPVPARGYWAKKQAGQAVEPEPLPTSTGITQYHGHKAQRVPVDESSNDVDEALSFLSQEEFPKVWQECMIIRIDPEKRKLHPVVVQHNNSFKSYGKRNPRDQYASFYKDTYRAVPEGEPPYYGKVSEEALPRIHRILDALFCSIEKLGGKVNSDLSVQIRGELIKFSFSEGQEQVKHVLTKDEQKKLDNYEKEKLKYRYVSAPQFRKYDYLPNGRLTFTINNGTHFRDTSNTVLESRLGEMLHSLYIQSETEHLARIAREEAQRKAEEEQRQKELRKRRYNDEVDRLASLKNEADDFAMACKIRAYAAAMAQQPNLTQETLDWIEWAYAKADWYDPTKHYDDPILGRRNHGAPKEPEKKYGWW